MSTPGLERALNDIFDRIEALEKQTRRQEEIIHLICPMCSRAELHGDAYGCSIHGKSSSIRDTGSEGK